MNTSLEIRNPLVDKVRQVIDVTHDESGRFHLSVKEGRNCTALLLSKALASVPKNAAIVLDTRECGGIDESIAGAIITHRQGGNRILVTTESGVERLRTMRFLNHDGTPRPGSGFSWQTHTCAPAQTTAMRPADAILQELATVIQELERPPERVAPQTPSLDQLISVDTTDNAVRVAVLAPIRGNYAELLQDYLRNLPVDKKVVIDLQGAGPDSTTAGAYGVLMAAKLRKRLGATPLEVVNIPPSLEGAFNPNYSVTLGFSIARADPAGA